MMRRSPMPQRRTPLAARSSLRAHKQLRRDGSALVRRGPVANEVAGTTSDGSLRRTGRIKPVSAKRAAENRIYVKRRREFLEANPACSWPAGCAFPATEVHHKRGRVGALYLNQAHWFASCHDHHRWITEHPRESVAMGVSELRVSA